MGRRRIADPAQRKDSGAFRVGATRAQREEIDAYVARVGAKERSPVILEIVLAHIRAANAQEEGEAEREGDPPSE